ncbi:GTP cyclohydrolase I FolE [Bdellovibrio svalbardensis]|uniref:GTP cyclohydrolase 1 n=1 Tax=Bdellovibrio svalbardensis TaxID=2972972 RepID=A0ABT6DLQ0_9BACT|nr:GTP cyclohydrolase I FolE [Bdellovibrio svalbardensis]MDG0816063.1 GTP cyclohydrolase I FolE [Bdellovibrio svalbardensis]
MAKKSSKKKVSPKVEEAHVLPLSVKKILANVRPTPMIENGLSNEDKIEKITEKFTEILEVLGLDLKDDSLIDTPKRIAKMYVNEVFGGLDPHKFPKMTVIENTMKYDQMIVIQAIECLSFCEHHFLPIDGVATVAYIPNKKVIGLSKINRIVQYFSRRPQVQERLTKQIADCLQYVLETDHVAVHINAKHYCVMMRGIEDTHSTTATSDLRGHFKTLPETREEFLHHCRLK